MSKFKVNVPSCPTPIEPVGIKDLIPDYISRMGELNQAEQSNIADAFVWAEKQNQEDILNSSFIFRLHKEMFGEVWKWVVKSKMTNKTVGMLR